MKKKKAPPGGILNGFSMLAEKAMYQAIEKSIFGMYWTPPSRPLVASDMIAAIEMGQPEVMEWIKAVSEAMKYQRKDTKEFMTEWRSNLWDLEYYLVHDVDSRTAMIPYRDHDKPEFSGLAVRYNSVKG